MSQLNARVKWDGKDFLCILNEGELPQIKKAYEWGKSVYAAINGFGAALEADYKGFDNKGYGRYNYPKYVLFTYDDSSMYMQYVELVKFGGMPNVGSITVEQCLKYATGQTTPRSGSLVEIEDYSLPLNHLVARKPSSVQNVANDLAGKGKGFFKSLLGKK